MYILKCVHTHQQSPNKQRYECAYTQFTLSFQKWKFLSVLSKRYLLMFENDL